MNLRQSLRLLWLFSCTGFKDLHKMLASGKGSEETYRYTLYVVWLLLRVEQRRAAYQHKSKCGVPMNMFQTK